MSEPCRHERYAPNTRQDATRAAVSADMVDRVSQFLVRDWGEPRYPLYLNRGAAWRAARALASAGLLATPDRTQDAGQRFEPGEADPSWHQWAREEIHRLRDERAKIYAVTERALRDDDNGDRNAAAYGLYSVGAIVGIGAEVSS